MADFLQVTTTTAEKADAQRIAAALVSERLGACVQISGPIESVYRWQGAVENATEWLCTIKTSRANYPALAQRIGELHPYDVPEIMATPIVDGSDTYLAWLSAELGGAGSE